MNKVNKLNTVEDRKGGLFVNIILLFFPIGTQYRSAIFYLNEEQKKIAEDLIDKANKSGVFPGEIATILQKFDKFYKAEEYHQDYLEKNPRGYTCHRIRKHWEF